MTQEKSPEETPPQAAPAPSADTPPETDKAAAAPQSPPSATGATAFHEHLSRSQKRRKALVILGMVLLVAGVGVLAWYLLFAEWNESTDDAYVQGDIAQISSLVPGTLVSVQVRDGDKVVAGDRLAQLDPADTELALAEAKAGLANAVRQSHGLYNQATSASSELTARRQAYQIARNDYERRQALAKTGAVSAEELDHARQAYDAAQSAYTVAQEHYSASNVLVQGTRVSTQPAVEMAAAKVRVAYLNAQRNAILSPLTGYVAKRSAQVGQRVQPGQALMAVVPLQDVWVDANFKETQLHKLRIGQTATIVSDVYGSKVTYKARVVSLGVGTGSVFSLLPAQNATGNWIKIVQRIPVRVNIEDAAQLQKYPLRLGMSVTVDVDIHDQNGPMLAQKPPVQPAQQTDVYQKQLQQADALIAQIIRDNQPGAGKGK